MTLRNNKKIYRKKSAKNVNRGGGNLITNKKETNVVNEKQANNTPTNEEMFLSTVITQEMVDKYQYPSEYIGYNVAIRTSDGVEAPFTILEMCKISWRAKEKPDWDAIRLLNNEQSDPLSEEVTNSFNMINSQFKKDTERDIRPILNQVNVVEKAREANDKTIYTTFDSLLDSNNVTNQVEQFEIKILVNQFPLSFSSDVITTILQKTIDNVVETSNVEPFPYIKDYIRAHKNDASPYVPTVQVYPPQLVVKDSAQWGWQDNFKSMEELENMDEKKITINTDNDNVIINESISLGFMLVMPNIAHDDYKNKYNDLPFLPIAIVELILYCNFNDDKAFIIWKDPTYIKPIQEVVPKDINVIEPPSQPEEEEESKEEDKIKINVDDNTNTNDNLNANANANTNTNLPAPEEEEESKEEDKIKINVDDNINTNDNLNTNPNANTTPTAPEEGTLPSHDDTVSNNASDISQENTENVIAQQEQVPPPSPNSEDTSMEDIIGKLSIGTLFAGAFAATALLTLMTVGIVGGKTRKSHHNKNIKQSTKQRKTIKLKKYNNKRNTRRVKYQKSIKPKTKTLTKKIKI
jgi:hypothetical protein